MNLHMMKMSMVLDLFGFVPKVRPRQKSYSMNGTMKTDMIVTLEKIIMWKLYTMKAMQESTEIIIWLNWRIDHGKRIKGRSDYYFTGT